MPITAPPRMTLEEFRNLPEDPPHFEFENGELIPMTSPKSNLQDIILVVGAALRRHVMRERLGRVFHEVDVYLPDRRVYSPDLTYLSAARLTMHDPEDQKIHGAPDLVVEVTSVNPSRDRIQKFKVYQDNGVPWYWIVDSDSLSIEEYRLTDEGYIRSATVPSDADFSPGLFPGLTFNLPILLAGEDAG
jgi:Uma2 family endonuclease